MLATNAAQKYKLFETDMVGETFSTDYPTTNVS
jgi:hypothetical protein